MSYKSHTFVIEDDIDMEKMLNYYETTGFKVVSVILEDTSPAGRKWYKFILYEEKKTEQNSSGMGFL